MMKITGARWNSDNAYYCVDYDDGITLFISEQYEQLGMISTGPDSYYLRKLKWPTGANLDKRHKLARVWIEKNQNRYRSKK